MALWHAGWGRTSFHSTLDFPSLSGRNLFLSVLLTCVPNSWPDWSKRNFAGGRLPSGRGSLARLRAAPVVRPYLALVVEWRRDVERALLGRDDRVHTPRIQPVAARHAVCVLHLLSLVCICSTGFLELSI